MECTVRFKGFKAFFRTLVAVPFFQSLTFLASSCLDLCSGSTALADEQHFLQSASVQTSSPTARASNIDSEVC